MNDIAKEYEIVVIKKEKAIVLASYHLFEKALDLIPVEEGQNKKGLDLENLL